MNRLLLFVVAFFGSYSIFSMEFDNPQDPTKYLPSKFTQLMTNLESALQTSSEGKRKLTEQELESAMEEIIQGIKVSEPEKKRARTEEQTYEKTKQQVESLKKYNIMTLEELVLLSLLKKFKNASQDEFEQFINNLNKFSYGGHVEKLKILFRPDIFNKIIFNIKGVFPTEDDGDQVKIPGVAHFAQALIRHLLLNIDREFSKTDPELVSPIYDFHAELAKLFPSIYYGFFRKKVLEGLAENALFEALLEQTPLKTFEIDYSDYSYPLYLRIKRYPFGIPQDVFVDTDFVLNKLVAHNVIDILKALEEIKFDESKLLYLDKIENYVTRHYDIFDDESELLQKAYNKVLEDMRSENPEYWLNPSRINNILNAFIIMHDHEVLQKIVSLQKEIPSEILGAGQLGSPLSLACRQLMHYMQLLCKNWSLMKSEIEAELAENPDVDQGELRSEYVEFFNLFITYLLVPSLYSYQKLLTLKELEEAEKINTIPLIKVIEFIKEILEDVGISLNRLYEESLRLFPQIDREDLLAVIETICKKFKGSEFLNVDFDHIT